ncbi:MAG: alpha/beta hydrolase [Thermoleophilaceae bacterium]|nr:alpha/beta hydrolase [Thermoleophilaceae bacterium]
MTTATPTTQIELSQGTIAVRDTGSGEPIVFVHGLLVDGSLWRKVTPPLEGEFRCVAPDWPLGSHRTPMVAGADLSPRGVANLIADALEAMGLDDVTLVGNDTGGAICQLVATERPERIGRLVLTNCDAFENFLPPMFRPLQWLGRVPPLLTAALQPLRLSTLHRLPIAFGMLTERPLPRDVTERWVRPFLSQRGVRRDTAKLLRGIDKRDTLAAAAKLASFDRPALIAWAPDNAFPVDHGRRLATILPQGRFVEVPDSRTFVSEDQPERLAELIAEFMHATPITDGAASIS